MILLAKITLVLLAGFSATLLMRKSSAAKRAHMWRIVAIALTLLPLLALTLPEWRVPADPLFTITMTASASPSRAHINPYIAVWTALSGALLLRLIAGNIILWRIA